MHIPQHSRVLGVAACVAMMGAAQAATLSVGPGQPFATPCQALAAADDGDLIEIDAAGAYAGDVCAIHRHGLTLRGVRGTPVLNAAGRSAEGKGIWVIKGNHTVVENIAFTNATVRDRNGAGIRQEGAHLTVRDCSFHHNENGILAGARADSDILIERSVFAFNGAGDGYSHNLYIGQVRTLTFRYNHSHDAVTGHLLKSRAMENRIEFNRLTNEYGGSSSYEVNLPNGGFNTLIGNIIQQPAGATNSTMVSVGEEGTSNPQQELYLINNTLVNDHSTGAFVAVYGTTTRAFAANNIFGGVGQVFNSPLFTSLNNHIAAQPAFLSRATMAYRAAPGAPFVNAGHHPGVDSRGQSLWPLRQYRDRANSQGRSLDTALDIGAMEWIAGEVQADLQAPHVAVVAPTSATVVRPGSTASIAIDAVDELGIARVDVLVGTTTLCRLVAVPFTCAWKVPRGKGNLHVITAVATDFNGNSTRSAGVSVSTR